MSARILMLVVAALLGGCATTAPTLTRWQDGSDETLEDLRGRVVVLSFWAEWCKPCLQEFPIVKRAVEDAGSGLVFFVVYYRERARAPSTLNDWLAQQPSSFRDRVRWGNSSFLAQYSVREIPKTYVLRRDGSIVREFSGAITAERVGDFRDALERALVPASTRGQ